MAIVLFAFVDPAGAGVVDSTTTPPTTETQPSTTSSTAAPSSAVSSTPSATSSTAAPASTAVTTTSVQSQGDNDPTTTSEDGAETDVTASSTAPTSTSTSTDSSTATTSSTTETEATGTTIDGAETTTTTEPESDQADDETAGESADPDCPTDDATAETTNDGDSNDGEGTAGATTNTAAGAGTTGDDGEAPGSDGDCPDEESTEGSRAPTTITAGPRPLPSGGTAGPVITGSVLRLPALSGPMVRWRGGSPDAAVITGRVIDRDGRTVAGLEVVLARTEPSGRTGMRLFPQRTSDDGTFRFEGLDAGCYAVGFRPPDRYRLSLPTGTAPGGSTPATSGSDEAERAIHRPEVCVDVGGTAGSVDRILDGPEPAEPFDVHLLHVNDHHSHLLPDTITLFDDGRVRQTEIGGFARVAGLIEERRDALASGVVTVHAGDATGGTAFHSVFGAAADAALMTEVCFDVFSLGRHELGRDPERLATFRAFLDDHPCPTAILDPSDPTVADRTDLDQVTTVRVGSRVIGVVAIGVGDIERPPTDRATPSQVDLARRRIARLTDRGIDHVVVVSNLGLDADLDLVSKLPDVDVVIGGGSQSLLGDVADRGLDVAGEYPIEAVNGDGDPACVVQAWQNGWAVGELSVTFDGVGRVDACAGTVHLLLDGEVDPSPEAEAVLAPYADAVDDLTADRIGTAAEHLCRERVPGLGFSNLCLRSQSAEHGGALPQLTAQAALARLPTADVALVGAGIAADDLPAGSITIADVYRAVPPDRALVTVELTGTDLVATVSEAVRLSTAVGGSTSTYPYAAGLRWTVTTGTDSSDNGDLDNGDPDNGVGGAVVADIEIQDREDGSWRAPDPSTIYRVVTEQGPLGGPGGELVLALGGDTGLTATGLLIDHIVHDLDGDVTVPDEPSTRRFTAAD